MAYDQQGNEVQHISGDNLNSSVPFHQRDEWWLRYPASVFQFLQLSPHRRQRPQAANSVGRSQRGTGHVLRLWQWLKGDVFRFCLVAVPFAVAAGSSDWKPATVFSLGLLALIGLDSLLISLIERLCLPLKSETAANICADIVPNVLQTTITVVALCINEISVARNLVIGSVLANLLIGIGTAIFCGGVDRKDLDFSVVSVTSMTTIVMVAAASIFVPVCMSQVLQERDQDMNYISRRANTMSNGIGVIQITLYLSFLFFKHRTHKEVLQEVHEEEEDSMHRREATRVYVSASTQTIRGLISALTIAGMIFISKYIGSSITPLAKTTAVTDSFLAIIVIPVVINTPNYVKAALLARSRPDITLSMNVTLTAVVGNLLFTLPILSFVGWRDKSILAGFTLHLAVTFMIGIWVTSVIASSKSFHYVNGIVCICLYIIMAVFLYQIDIDA